VWDATPSTSSITSFQRGRQESRPCPFSSDAPSPSWDLAIRRITFAVEDIDDVVARLRGQAAELENLLERFRGPAADLQRPPSEHPPVSRYMIERV
jgi:hypothetical protein